MLRWTCVLVVCLGLGVLTEHSDETNSEDSPRIKKPTSCPCGMSKKKRIVGGTKAQSNEFPWIVMLVVRNGRDALCGATIINTRIIITAAHCVADLPQHTQLSVIAGTSDANRPGQIIRVSKWLAHERYYAADDGSVIANDIALLKLERSLKFDAKVGPVCMPTGKYNIENQFVKIIGWGQLGGSLDGTRTLMNAKVRVITFSQCQSVWGLIEPQQQICTQSPISSACMGDSGGPVAYLDPETRGYTLVGLVSFGDGSCDSYSRPNVMTEVSVFLPWIKSKIKSIGCHKINRRPWKNFRNIT